MPTKRDTTHESDDQGGESPCFMCLLDEAGLMPDQHDMTRTPPHAQNDGHPAQPSAIIYSRAAAPRSLSR